MKKTSGYEDDFVALIGASVSKGRHWDCTWNGLPIEVKKGKNHAWLNLLRYAEYLLNKKDEPVVTLFLFYSGDRVSSIFGLSMGSVFAALGLSEAKAKAITEFDEDFGHQLNVQCLLSKSEVSKNADFHIDCS